MQLKWSKQDLFDNILYWCVDFLHGAVFKSCLQQVSSVACLQPSLALTRCLHGLQPNQAFNHVLRVAFLLSTRRTSTCLSVLPGNQVQPDVCVHFVTSSDAPLSNSLLKIVEKILWQAAIEQYHLLS